MQKLCLLVRYSTVGTIKVLPCIGSKPGWWLWLMGLIKGGVIAKSLSGIGGGEGVWSKDRWWLGSEPVISDIELLDWLEMSSELWRLWLLRCEYVLTALPGSATTRPFDMLTKKDIILHIDNGLIYRTYCRHWWSVTFILRVIYNISTQLTIQIIKLY